MQLPRADIIACKHCGAPVALIPRPAIVGRFSLTCQECKVTFPVYPIAAPPVDDSPAEGTKGQGLTLAQIVC